MTPRPTPTRADGPPPVVFLFPGLGDHHLDMGRDLYREHAVFAEQVDACARLLQPELGLDLREVVFTDRAEPAAADLDLRSLLGRGASGQDAQEQRLNRTGIAQPALFVVEYALAKLWESWGVRPDMMIGYSLGEYVAACLAGVMSLPDALALVARRARLIEESPEGAMLAVMLPEDAVRARLGERLSVSAVNGPEFCVVAGPAPDVADLERALAADAVVTRRVQSTHAFHSTMMEPLADRVTRLARDVALAPPRIPYVSNVTGRPVTDAEATDPAYWARHLCSPVRFAEGIRAVGPDAVLLEVGPGQTLSSMAADLRGGDTRTVVASMRHRLEPRSDTDVLRQARERLNGAATEAPAPASDASAPPAAETEPTDTERRLHALWARLLPDRDIPVDVSFFEIGGNSLLATRLLLRISRTFGVELPLRRVYEMPTLAKLAAAVDAAREGRDPEAPGDAARTAPVATVDVADRPRYRLPNGLTIHHQNEAETRHFYEDIFDHRTYAKHGIRVPDGATVVDVGGNIGLFTLFAHYEAKDVRVLTFEPAPPLFELLGRNVADHGVNATLFNIGVADHEGEASFTFYPRSSGMSSFHPDEEEEKHNLRTIIANQQRTGAASGIDGLAAYADELVDVRFEAVPFTARLRPLSAVLAEQKVECVDLIKIDVQKSEQQVIDGIAASDWPKIRQMVLEAHDAGGRVAHLVRLLEGHGFTVVAEQDELYAGTDIHNIYATRGA